VIAAMSAGLLGFDSSAQLIDSVDDTRMGLDEVGSGLLGTFQLADLGIEAGALAFGRPHAGFRRVPPCTLGALKRGGADLEVVAAPESSNEPAVGVFGTA
jgi:hypothetical protein